MLLPWLMFTDRYINRGAYSPQRERLLKISMKLSSSWRLPNYYLNGSLFISQDPKKTIAPTLKITTRQIAKKVALGEPKPQMVLELFATPEPRLCLSEDVPEYDATEIKSSCDLGA